MKATENPPEDGVPRLISVAYDGSECIEGDCRPGACVDVSDLAGPRGGDA
jgi:hypothetical protein